MGEEPLLQHCATSLLQAGHQIEAVVTEDPALVAWAETNDLRRLAPDAYQEAIVGIAPDVFFSIANLRIVPEEVLRAVQVAAINFHDGILPEYAGLNIPSWSLANREREHGVTWHLMEPSVDSGGILKQKIFEIDETTTAQVLNLQCFEVGLSSFRELVDELTGPAGIGVQPQADAPSRYYAKMDRPAGGSFVRWSESAPDICALYRATTFGTAANPFARARLQVGDKVYLVAGMQCPPPSDTATDGAVGELLEITSERLLVQATPGIVGITALREADGREVRLDAVADHHELAVGEPLPVLSPDETALLERRSAKAIRAEAQTLRRLIDHNKLELPFVRPENGNRDNDRVDRWHRVPGQALQTVLDRAGSVEAAPDLTAGEYVAAAFAVFLARVTGIDRYTLGLADESTKIDPRFEDLFARQVPVQVEAGPDLNVDRLVDLVFEIHDARDRGSFLRDVAERYPSLRNRGDNGGLSTYDVLVKVDPDPATRRLPDGTSIVVVVQEDGTRCRWIADAETVEPADFEELIGRFQDFLARFVDDLTLLAATPDAEITTGDGAPGQGVVTPGSIGDLPRVGEDDDSATEDVEDAFPLSPMQQGMLYHVLSDPEAGMDVEQMVWTLDEPINSAAFRASWAATIRQHPILRTRFRWSGVSDPVQEVLRSADMSFIQMNLRDAAPAEQEALVESYLEEDRRRGIPMDEAPMMRLTLFDLAEDRSRMVWTFSHAILDGRSFTRIIQEVFDRYDAIREGRSIEVDAAPPFRDYITWLETQDWSPSESYWRSYLDGVTSGTTLDIVDPAAELPEATPVRSRRRVVCSQEETTAVREAASAAEVTMNTMVSTAWGVLLRRYTGRTDIVFGATRAGRKGTVDAADDMVGVFINTVPVRMSIEEQMPVRDLLAQVRHDWIAHRPYEHAALSDIQRWSGISTDQALFDSLVVFEKYELGEWLQHEGGDAWSARNVRLLQHTGYPITLYGYDGPCLRLEIEYDPTRYDDGSIDRLLRHLRQILSGLADRSDAPVRDVSMVPDSERFCLLTDWNDTDTDHSFDRCIHELFEEQVGRTPGARALSFGGTTLSYRQLNARANQLARHLKDKGATTDTLVGVHLHRSVDLVVSLMAILKAGAAYVPLDPAFPADRIALMVEDAGVGIVVTETGLVERVPDSAAEIVAVDAIERLAEYDADNLGRTSGPEDVAYVIYTSGSTGRPKGVVVEHRNVANFFVGMDDRIEHDPPGVWLAVTSISFDISVLELFWTLARGFHVVLHSNDVDAATMDAEVDTRQMDFSLFYFSSNEREVDAAEKYRVLVEGAKFGDQHGFKAVWSPERHFHAFGGLFPNPSVTSAALATITDQIEIRAGSCVSPLHDSIRIAEEWSVVDNLSKGRVGISFAAGWQPNDFVLKPENYANRKARMFEQIDEVQALWRGESMHRETPDGREVDLKVLPRPVQDELPVWITAAGNPETFRMAGEKGYHLLTHLLGQSVEELTEKIQIYREARREHGHDPETGTVTLMLHTYVGTDTDDVRDLVREPMKEYLRSSVGLIKAAAWSFPTFKEQTTDENGRFSVDHLDEEAMDEVLEFSFSRYFETSGLFGDEPDCLERIHALKEAEVNEIACLVDFGVDTDAVLSMLPRLATIKEKANATVADQTIAGQIQDYGVTHLQCTPTQGRLLVADPSTREALPALRRLMLGGEALPASLAAEVRDELGIPTTNMYGPTETTIWSTTHELEGDEPLIPIGRPIANTQIYVLDDAMRPVPVGVPGNLYIGGTGVTRGYLNRPDLTAERFVPDPFRGGDATMYWTGDQARYRSDGTIDFLGRTDFQVKVRGYRIELGEIETALSAHDSVRDVVVMVREDEPGDKRIVAYAVPADDALASDEALRAFLGETLPEYMIPTHFVEMDVFPTTPNKKTDRKALPAPAARNGRASVDLTLPQTATEQAVASVWYDVLHIDRAGIHESFFDLGGNSLLALRLVSSLQEALGVSMPLHAVASSPTIARMAEWVTEQQIESAGEAALEAALENMDRLSDEEIRAMLDDAASGVQPST
jgi:natural product biosynthesis luciferase-like monooxygenase protein